MAGTKLYLRATTANSHPASIDSASKSAALPVGSDKSATAQTARDLSTTKGSSQTSRGWATGTSAVQISGRFNTWVSAPLGGSNIQAQNWTIAMAGMESNADANQLFCCSIYVLKSDGTVRGYIYDSATQLATEFQTAERERVATVSGAAVTGVQNTDVLCFELWATGTPGTSSRTITAYWDGTTEPTGTATTSDAGSYIQAATDDIFAAGGGGGAPSNQTNFFAFL